MLEEQHREGEKSDWVWLPHTANSILGTLVRVRGELIGGALGVSRNSLAKVLPTSSVTCIQK